VRDSGFLLRDRASEPQLQFSLQNCLFAAKLPEDGCDDASPAKQSGARRIVPDPHRKARQWRAFVCIRSSSLNLFVFAARVGRAEKNRKTLSTMGDHGYHGWRGRSCQLPALYQLNKRCRLRPALPRCQRAPIRLNRPACRPSRANQTQHARASIAAFDPEPTLRWNACLWESYNFACAAVWKTYVRSGTKTIGRMCVAR
jgi:hypothetical protein